MTISLLRPGGTATRLPPAERPLAASLTQAAKLHGDLYGGCSIQVFDPGTNCALLSNAHADANGFLNYVNQFDQISFHFEDGGVEAWEYGPTDGGHHGTFGMDAVRVFYHSGHGGMDETTGVFYAPMGAAWNGQDWAYSNTMALGDRFLRYLFWSTCGSLEVLHGQSPIKTWQPVNRGLRMIFGFQGTCLDSPDYGARFFREWQAGKSFSQAWQDASLAISTHVQVSSSACGASAADAQNRLWNERLFHDDAASSSWYWWRWTGDAPGAAPCAAYTDLPPLVKRLTVAGKSSDEARAAELLARYGVVADSPHLTVFPDGSHEMRFAEPDRSAPLAIFADLRDAADAAIALYAVAGAVTLVFDRATATFHAGGPAHGQPSPPAIADLTLHYRQSIDGIPVVTGGDGHVQVTLDPSGTLVRIVDTTRQITRSAEPGAARTPRDPGEMIERATQALLRHLAASGVRGLHADRPCNPHEIGYRLTAQGGVLVARCEIEVVSGRFRKLHALEVPL